MTGRYFTSQRAAFPKGRQAVFINRIINKLNIDIAKLASILKVHIRTVRDWKREKYTISLHALNILCKITDSKIPSDITIKEQFWYVSRGGVAGARAVYKKYGFYGFDKNPEHRKKRWSEWWEKKGKLNKNKYFVTRTIQKPPQDQYLAEYIGIVLGDGGITDKQVTITLNKRDDSEYARYVSKISRRLFGIKPSWYGRESVWNITISRKELVSYLVTSGLIVGNKVKLQVEVPTWIQEDDKFSKCCIRGLIDTDGCFYVEKHQYKNKIYSNCVINFTNRSLPLLKFVMAKLIKFGFSSRKGNKYSVCISKENDVQRYFKEIGSSNPKHRDKFVRFFREKYGGVPKWS